MCFLTVGGSATCFGDGVPRLSKRENQLQQLSFFRCCTDTYGQLQPTGTDYATISAGGNFACGILRNGYPSCWCAATCTPTTNSPLIRRDRQGQQLEQPGVGHAHHSARHHRCRLVPRNVDFGARARCAHLLGSGVRNHPHWLTVVLVSDLLSLPLLTCSHTFVACLCVQGIQQSRPSDATNFVCGSVLGHNQRRRNTHLVRVACRNCAEFLTAFA